MQKKPYNQECPIARTLDIVGDRWTLLIVRDLFLGRARFSQFLESCPGLPPRLLSGRLKRLEERGLVGRAVYSQHPLRAEYRLTELGRSLFPILRAMVEWGVEHLYADDPEQARRVRTTFDQTSRGSTKASRQVGGPPCPALTARPRRSSPRSWPITWR